MRARRVDKIVNVPIKDPLKEVDYLHEYLLTVSSILYLKTYFRLKTFYLQYCIVVKGLGHETYTVFCLKPTIQNQYYLYRRLLFSTKFLCVVVEQNRSQNFYYLLEITTNYENLSVCVFLRPYSSDKEPENTSRKPPVIWNMLKDDTFSLHPIRDIDTREHRPTREREGFSKYFLTQSRKHFRPSNKYRTRGTVPLRARTAFF